MTAPTIALSDAPDSRATPAALRRRERLALTVEGLRVELLGGWRTAADARSGAQFALAALAYRRWRGPARRGGATRRRFRLRDGTELSYRNERGDVRAIAEVWLSDAYRLPFELRPRNLVDLGANIGTAGVWFARRCGATRVVAVEPVPENAALARLNFERNRIDAEVIEAAIAPTEGKARFARSSTSTLGRLGPGDLEVSLVTPAQILGRFPPEERIDLVKIDVEGAEQQLFQGELEWLDRVDCIVMELHTDRVDWRGIIEALRSRGFSAQEIGIANKYRGLADVTMAFRR